MDTFTWVLTTLLVVVVLYEAHKRLRRQYLEKERRRYRDWIPNAKEILRALDFDGHALAAHEICEKLRDQRNALYFRSVWLSFLEQDLEGLVATGNIEKIEVSRTTKGDHKYSFDAYRFTNKGAWLYRHLHPRSTSAK